MDFKKWIESEEGKKCNDFSTLKGQPYLKNRLWFAFTSGCESVNSKISELQKENKALKRRIKDMEDKSIIDEVFKNNDELKRPYIRDWLNSYAIKNGYESISHAIENSISVEDDIAMLIETFSKISKQ